MLNYMILSVLIVTALTPVLGFTVEKTQVGSFHEITRIELGGEGGWDCLINDDSARRLYIARSNRILVVDSDSGKSTGEVAGLEGAHGIALGKDWNRGFASSGRTNEVFVFDLTTLKTLAKIKVGENPDIMLFDSASKRILSFNGKSQDVTSIDPKGLKAIGTLKLPGKPEFAVSDSAGKIFVNLEDKNSMAVIDSKQMKVITTFELSPCEEPTGLSIDSKTHRLIVGCGNKTAVIVNTETGKVLQSFKVGDGVDGTAFDSDRNLAYISAGEGVLTILSEDSSQFHWVQDLSTSKGARTLTVDEKTGRVFLPIAKYESPKSGDSGKSHLKPAMVPESFAILVVGKDSDKR